MKTRRSERAWAFRNKVRDVAVATITPAHFERIVHRYREAAGVMVEGNLIEAETGGVLRFLVEGGDLSRWGLCSAVTRLSQEANIS
jgi:hypothetical protein